MPVPSLFRATLLACTLGAAVAGCSVESPSDLRVKAEALSDRATAAGESVEKAADTTATGLERVIEVAEPIQASLEVAWDNAKAKVKELDTPIPGATPATPPDPKFFE